MDITPPEEPFDGDATRKQTPQDATNSAMETFMMALQRYGAEQGRFANIPSNFEEALLTQLETLTAQLAPLRDLSPRLEGPREAVVAELMAIRDNLARPDWNNAKRLDPGARPNTNPFAGGAVSPGLPQSS